MIPLLLRLSAERHAEPLPVRGRLDEGVPRPDSVLRPVPAAARELILLRQLGSARRVRSLAQTKPRSRSQAQPLGDSSSAPQVLEFGQALGLALSAQNEPRGCEVSC